jgi:L-alanine-DL-glutamate epimerase-like enolase superfamily enzyme
MRISRLECLHADAGFRNFDFLKISTDEGIVGWSEYNESFGLPVYEMLGGPQRERIRLYWSHCGIYRLSWPEEMRIAIVRG